MDCRVVVEAAVPVYDVETQDEAVRIAISKTGDMLNPDLNYVEISMDGRSCPHCEGHLDPAFVAADEGLVALDLEMTVFNVEDEQHASRIARKEIGQRMHNIPLEIRRIEVIEEDEEGEDEGESESEEASGEVTGVREATDAADPALDADGEEMLPEFEDLIDE